jgi:hypothetical protein
MFGIPLGLHVFYLLPSHYERCANTNIVAYRDRQAGSYNNRAKEDGSSGRGYSDRPRGTQPIHHLHNT